MKTTPPEPASLVRLKNSKTELRPVSKRDRRTWQILFVEDPVPYTTRQLFDYADQCNAESVNEEGWVPIELVDTGENVYDVSKKEGEDGHHAACLWRNRHKD